jgi:2,3-dihydroxybenzoate-AMP ligase
LSLRELCQFLLEDRKIAKFKLPEHLEQIEALPLTNVGKVTKKLLREMIAAKIKNGG